MSEELKCYQVGDHDWYAAHNPEEALKLHLEIDNDFDEGIDEVKEESDRVMDMQWVDEDTHEKIGTLRDFLAEATEPGWLVGNE